MRYWISIVILCVAAHAQSSLPAMLHFVSNNTTTMLEVSATSVRAVLPASGMKDGGSVLVWNTGIATARIAFGEQNVIATSTTKLLVGPGCFIAFAQGNASYLAAISDSATSLKLLGGHGLPEKGCVK